MLSRQQIEKPPRLWRIASALVLILGAIIAFIALPGFALPHRIDSHNIPQVWVPPGCFKMGVDPVKEPHVQGEALLAHTVCLTHGYWIDQYDVTNAAFAAFVRSGGYTTNAYWSVDGLAWRHAKAHDLAQSGSSLGVTPASCCACSTDLQQPHNCVSYYEAQAYANWRTQTSQDGLLYRLPTEAEWEYAARGPLDWIYPWGNTFDPSKANTKAAGLGDVTTEGSYPTGASWVGAQDMAGNVDQWVADWYASAHYLLQCCQASPQIDPLGPTNGLYRVTRGSSFYDDPATTVSVRRGLGDPVSGEGRISFRLVAVVPTP